MLNHIDDALWRIYQSAYFRPCSPLPLYNGAILSLWNPNGKIMCNERNHQLTRFWKGALQRSGLDGQWIWGGDNSMQYRELSIYIPCSIAVAHLWSKRAKQNAFYYVKEGQLYLHATRQSIANKHPIDRSTENTQLDCKVEELQGDQVANSPTTQCQTTSQAVALGSFRSRITYCQLPKTNLAITKPLNN